MKINSGDTTHRARAVAPEQFRAQATGIGQTRSASLATGVARAQRVVDQADPACVACIPEAEGFPPRTPDDLGGVLATASVPFMRTRRLR